MQIIQVRLSLVIKLFIKQNNGNDNEPFLHIHVNMSNHECKSFGGHLFSGVITATCEIKMFISDTKVVRKKNEDIGLHLWDLSDV